MSGGLGCRRCGREFPGAGLYELCGASIGRRLTERVGEIVEELLPAGKYEQRGREYRVGSAAGEPGRSLVIEIGGRKSGLWYDHSADEGGDLIDLIGRCRGGGAGEGLRWGRQWLAEPERRRPVRSPGQARGRLLPVQAPRDEAETRDIAERIWRQAAPLSRGDLVCRYLAGRAIDLERLAQANDGKLPAGLRFHARLWNRETRRAYPAMVAAIIGREGQFLAVHRTWLIEGPAGGVTKAPVDVAKMTLGHYRLADGAGCVRLWRPRWREADIDDMLGLAEGVEDGLTAALSYPEWRVAAAVSLSAMLSTWIPPVITKITLIAQNDKSGSRAALLQVRVRERFHAEGRRLWLLEPPRWNKDVNEVLMHLGVSSLTRPGRWRGVTGICGKALGSSRGAAAGP